MKRHPNSRIQLHGAWTALLLGLLLAAGALEAAARPAEEDKIPGFTRYTPVEVTSIYWKDKRWEKRDSITVEMLPGFQAGPDAVCEYGGLAGSKGDQASGFFHAWKDGERWWLVDPDGHRFLTLGMCSVSMNETARGRAALQAAFGDEQGWARKTVAQLRGMGVNTLGCWSSMEPFKAAGARMPYTVQLNLMAGYGKKRGGTYQQPGHTGYPNDCIFVFDEQFEDYCDQTCKQLAENKDDPWLFGYFTDNEMPLKNNALDNYLKLPEGDPGRKAAVAWLMRRKGSADPKGITAEDRSAFLSEVVRRYYRTVYTAIKKHDPNHMVLGSRFHSSERDNPEVMAAVGPYVDCCAFNYYNVWAPDYAKTRMWSKAMNKPYIVTEFYAKGMDSGMGNTTGAGWTVKTQKDRGMFYQNFCMGLLADPGCVGWHYFKYQDNDPTNMKTDPSNRDSNKGIVTWDYKTWPPLVDAIRALNVKAYAVREYLLERKICE